MFKKSAFLLLGLFIGFAACKFLQKTPEPWIPVIEGTSFVFFNDPVARAIHAVQTAQDRIESDQESEAKEQLQQAMESLSRLNSYYVPMTEVRQLVYDADRLFYLKRIPEAKKKLDQTKDLLQSVGHADGHSLRKPTNEFILMIDELILSIDTAPDEASREFQLVGNRVNLMLLRGELELAGTELAE